VIFDPFFISSKIPWGVKKNVKIAFFEKSEFPKIIDFKIRIFASPAKA